jgi:septal ring factor EnvC (AmiA/AmiB activator)
MGQSTLRYKSKSKDRTSKISGMTFALAMLLALGVGGCTTVPEPSETVVAGPPPAETAAKRFQDTPLQGRTAVESALELSEKYAKLSDQTVSLRQENQRLTTDNENLRQQITALEAKLKQTQKELGEANDLLIEMLTELNNWKSNILGFRGEMRQAAQAQLEALLKVLEILGGQAEAGAIERKHAGTLNPDVNDVKVAGQSATPLGREPNAAP